MHWQNFTFYSTKNKPVAQIDCPSHLLQKIYSDSKNPEYRLSTHTRSETSKTRLLHGG